MVVFTKPPSGGVAIQSCLLYQGVSGLPGQRWGLPSKQRVLVLGAIVSRAYRCAQVPWMRTWWWSSRPLLQRPLSLPARRSTSRPRTARWRSSRSETASGGQPLAFHTRCVWLHRTWLGGKRRRKQPAQFTSSLFKVLYYANLTLPMFSHSRLQEHRYWTDRRLCWISWNLTHF